MVDYSFVDNLRELSLQEAVELLLEGQLSGGPLDYRRKWAMQDRLIKAIKGGQLPYTDQFPNRALTDCSPDVRYRIKPSDLKAWCESQGLKPAFLFSESDREHEQKGRIRLKKKIDNLQKQWELLNKKLSELNKQEILETRVDEKLRLKDLIDDTQTRCDQVEEQLEDISRPSISIS